MSARAALVALVLFGGLGGLGSAHGRTFEALGTAKVTAADAAGAREAALADADRQAVAQAVAELVEAGAREANAELVKKRILRRAASFVSARRVVEEGAEEGLFHVVVEVTLQLDALEAELKALGLPVAGVAPVAVVSRRAGVLVAASASAATAVLEQTLVARGFEPVRIAAPDAAAGAEGRDGADAAHDERLLAAARGPGLLVVVVATATTRDEGRIRGTPAWGASAAVRVRLVVPAAGTDPTAGTVVGDARGEAAGWTELAAAEDRAATLARATGAAILVATTRALTPLAPALGQLAPPPTASIGLVVDVLHVSRLADLTAVERALGTVPGVERLLPVELAPGRVRFVVLGTARAAALLAALTAAGLPGQARGGVVVVDTPRARDGASP
ncbi:MAG: hypothetical protein EXR73_04450 [Myxococcales bacterium]|nr:hypothetical protein [Myxococcales bacterium]